MTLIELMIAKSKDAESFLPVSPTASDVSASRNIPGRVNVLGVGISKLNLESATRAVADALASGLRGYACITGVHGVSEAQADPSFRQILNRSWLTTPDGMPMVWMGKLQRVRDMGRVYGPDLMLKVCEFTEGRGYRHFFYGGAEGVAGELIGCLRKKFPKLEVAGSYTPPFRPLTPEEDKQLVAQVAAHRPDIFWVGLSTPKQERFMAEYSGKLDARLFFGVGAAFDFHAGRVPQAPKWMQASGLEWLFRLKCEPRRLWKRYLKNNPLFIGRAFLQLTGLKKYPLD